MDKRFLIAVAAIVAVVNAGVYLMGSEPAPAGTCTVEIASPAPGDWVEIEAVASGTAVVPEGAHLWLFARPRENGRWWPQSRVDITSGVWREPVRFGIPEQTGVEFYLTAAMVRDRVDARLGAWADRFVEGESRPMAFPEVVDGCPVEIVAVRRAQ